MHDLIQFAEWHEDEPDGWQDINLEGQGVGGKAEIRAFIIQIQILENHQNGKDTHVRGVQIFAKDERPAHMRGVVDRAPEILSDRVDNHDDEGGFRLPEPTWIQEPQIR